jgi:hypothetical protein
MTAACIVFVTRCYKYGILNATCKSQFGMRLGKLQNVRRISFLGPEVYKGLKKEGAVLSV